MNQPRYPIATACYLLILAGGVLRAPAQVNTATIYGNVKDSSGAIVPETQVSLNNSATGASLSTTSNADGEFTFTFVPVGTYTLNLRAHGFKTLSREGLVLNAGQNLRLNLTMQLGEIRDVVTVSAEAALVNAVNAQQEQSVGTRQIKQLPTPRLDWTNLLDVGTGISKGGNSGVTLNGLPPASFSLTVDGTNATSDPEFSSLGMYQNFNTIKVISPDAIQEVTVTKGIAPAEIAGTMSGNVNIISKNGTNEFHGDVFENNQVAAYNARNSLLATKPGDTFNQYGGALGGPILRNRLFFFATYEGLQERAFKLVSGDTPTPYFRNQALAANPAYDTVLKLYPLPNQPFRPTDLTARYIASGATASSDNHGVLRGDYQITSNDLLTMRYTHSEPGQTIPRVVSANSRSFISSTNDGTLSYTHSWSTAVAVTRFGYNRISELRLDGLHNIAGVANLRVAGLDNSGGEAFSIDGSNTDFEQTIALSRGRNSIKFGVIFQRMLDGRNDVDIPELRYNSFSDFLAQTPSQLTLNFGVLPFALWSDQLGGFVQDDFKVNRRLTLNVGVRYDYFTVPKERDGRLFNRSEYGFGPLQPPSAVYDPDTNNFAPRIGFAYSLDDAAKTVVRGGFGMFISPHPIFGGPIDLVQNSLTLPFRAILTGQQVQQFGLNYPVTNSEAQDLIEKGLQFPYSNISINTNFPDPFSLQYTLTVERQLSDSMLLSVGYAGNRGVNLNMVRYQNLPDRITNIQPVSGFGTFRYWDTSNSSNYNSLQASLKKRFSSGLTFDLNYTWARSMGYGTSDLLLESPPQDNNDIRSDYGPTPFDVRHMFIGSVLYELPLAQLFSSGNPFVRQLVGGWQVGSVFSAQTGSPLNITEDSNYESSRPDYVGGEAISNNSQRTLLYLNPSAFAMVPTPNGNPVRPGNLGRNGIYGPGSWDIDFSLAKDFAITEKLRLQLRGDAFNVLNHPNAGGIVADLTKGSFGTINSLSSRTLQLGARLSF
jgi:hypothetical protein